MDNKEYIERGALLKQEQEICYWNGLNDVYGDFIPSKIVHSMPAADVAPVRHGMWYEEEGTDAYGAPIYRCSHCNRTIADYYISQHKYCLHCGAKMDGGNK